MFAILNYEVIKQENKKNYKVYNSMPMLRKIVFSYNYQICKVITCQICKIVDLVEKSGFV